MTRQMVIALPLLVAACDDGPTSVQALPGVEVGIVVSSGDRVATMFVVDTPKDVVQIGLGPDGTPVTVAARHNWAVVPMGTFPAVTIVDLRQRRLTATVALPLNSGATGAAFINDSIALVANPQRNSVISVNVLRATAGAEIAVGTYPQSIAAVGDTAYVLNSELGPDLRPARNGTVTVLAGHPARLVGTIELSGTNPLAAVAGGSGELYVLNAGLFGGGNGSLSTIDRQTLRETRSDSGFGDFPGALGRGSDGNLYIGSFTFGVAIWQPASRMFLRTPANAIRPGSLASNSGLGVDAAGRVYALEPDCRAPSRAFRLSATFDIDVEISTGICPFGIAFTRVPSAS
jgi:hypothetical protein